jgi:cytochrome bd-type quinol oxidase subunit 2
MILRTVALEFRSKEPAGAGDRPGTPSSPSPRRASRSCLGVAFGNIVDGLPLDAQGNISTG